MSKCPISNILDPDVFTDGMPYDSLRELRDRDSLIYMDDPITGVPYWMVTRRKELDFIERRPDLFSSQARSALPMEHDQTIVDGIYANMLINMDDPRHMKMRKVVRDAFTPASVKQYIPFLKKHARLVVDQVASKGHCEFVKDVASELPLYAILYLLDVPAQDRQKIFEWTNTMMFADDPDASEGEEAGQAAAAELMEYARELKHRWTSEPKDTVSGALLRGKIDGQPLTDDEFMWMFLMVITAGNESTRTAISHAMRLLIEHPEQLQWLKDNPGEIPNAVDEIVRYNTSFTCMKRTAMKDIELSGKLIRRGDKVLLHYHTVNHDENVFGEDAMQFDVTRALRHKGLSRDLRSFGTGSHFCLGMHLAKLEIQIMLEEILPRMRNPRFAGDIKYMRSYFISGIREMPISFDPEL